MQLISGDETGLLKVVDVMKNAATAVSSTQSRRRGVVALACADEGRFHCARKSGELETWSFGGELEASYDGLAGECVGLSHVDGRVVSCSDDGVVQVSSLNGKVGDSASFDVSGAVSAVDRQDDVVAVGGREHELSLWDLGTQERRWRARNVVNDKLDMRRPVWVGAARFLTDTTLVVGTRYKQIRVYDVRAKRRPVADADDVTEHAVRQLIALTDAVLLGDVAGDVITFDLKKMRMRHRYAGPAGSVRALAKHPHNDALFAAAGLDRHCHIWDASSTKDKAAVASIYCKQRLNALLWIPFDADRTTEDVGPLLEDD